MTIVGENQLLEFVAIGICLIAFALGCVIGQQR